MWRQNIKKVKEIHLLFLTFARFLKRCHLFMKKKSCNWHFHLSVISNKHFSVFLLMHLQSSVYAPVAVCDLKYTRLQDTVNNWVKGYTVKPVIIF